MRAFKCFWLTTAALATVKITVTTSGPVMISPNHCINIQEARSWETEWWRCAVSQTVSQTTKLSDHMLVLDAAPPLLHSLSLPAAQLPQLLKILWTGSAAGLSLSSALLQLYAFSCPVVYAMANNFPPLYVFNDHKKLGLCWFTGRSDYESLSDISVLFHHHVVNLSIFVDTPVLMFRLKAHVLHRPLGVH